jgi:hypothetical protein
MTITRAWVQAFLGALAGISVGACASFHSAQEIRGNVADAETGAPLNGVIVVAQWEPYYQGNGHAPGHRGVVHIHETVTNKHGQFVIPSWGPKPLPVGAIMKEADPALRFFKPGYMPFGAVNSIFMDPRARRAPPGISEWNGKVVTLSKSSGSVEAYADRLGVLSRGLVDPQDNWKSFPKMAHALWQEEKRLPSGTFGRFGRLSPIDVDSLSAADRAYLEEQAK